MFPTRLLRKCRGWLLLALLCMSFGHLQAQRRPGTGTTDARGFGLRIATDVVQLSNDAALPITRDTWSALVLGLHYRQYNRFGGYELGLNFLFKDPAGGGFSIPVVADGTGTAEPLAYTALEAAILVGPRFADYFYPRIGLQLGYRARAGNFQTAPLTNESGQPVQLEPNRLYARVPLGLSLEFPTVWGSVGAGAYYQVTLTSFVRDPGGLGRWDPVNANGWRFEVHVMFNRR